MKIKSKISEILHIAYSCGRYSQVTLSKRLELAHEFRISSPKMGFL